jgi:hypothetical protein
MDLEGTILMVVMQNQQMAAGCPADCLDTPTSCNKDFEEMPVECRTVLLSSLEDDGCDSCTCCYR